MIINTNNTKTSKTWKELLNYPLKLLWVSSFFFFVAVFLLFSANCLNQNFFHSRDKNGPPPVDQVVVEDRQRHPPWVFRYLKGPSRIDLGKIDATSTNSRGWFLKVMEKYVNVMCTIYIHGMLLFVAICLMVFLLWNKFWETQNQNVIILKIVVAMSVMDFFLTEASSQLSPVPKADPMIRDLLVSTYVVTYWMEFIENIIGNHANQSL